jgi:hypothetical protein
VNEVLYRIQYRELGKSTTTSPLGAFETDVEGIGIVPKAIADYLCQNDSKWKLLGEVTPAPAATGDPVDPALAVEKKDEPAGEPAEEATEEPATPRRRRAH